MHQPQHSHLQAQSMQFTTQSQLQTLQPNIQPQIQTNIQPQMQTNIQPQTQMQTNIRPQIQTQLQTSTHPQMQQLHTCIHPQMQTQQAQIQPQIQAHIQAQIQSQIQTHIQPQIQTHIQPQIQTHIQPQIQTHIQPQIQAHLQTQLQPQVMLCPVQYIPRMLVPSSQAEDAVQQNNTFQSPTFIINVQNPPPWIQNRNAYLPQMQLNNIPYIHQNMVQNPVINYYQPMVMEHRIIPSVINQQQTTATNNNQQINQNVNQQIVHTAPNKSQEVKQEPASLPHTQTSEAPSQTQTTKPQYSTIAQMITVNPLTLPQTSEVPQHIRSQLPDSLSVKTYKPPQRIESQGTVAPPTDHKLPKPVMRNSTTNTEPKVKRKREVDHSNEPIHKRSCVSNQEDIDNVKNTQVKITVDSLPMINVAAVNSTLRNAHQKTNITQTPTSVDRPKMEEKLLRNTVFVQARGRVNETVQNELINNNSQVNVLRRNPPETREKEKAEPSNNETSNKSQSLEPITSEEEFKDSCASVYVPRSIKNKKDSEDIGQNSSHSKTEIHNTNIPVLNIQEALLGKNNQAKITELISAKQDQETHAFKANNPMFSGNATHMLRNHEKQVFLLTKVIEDKTTAETKSGSSKCQNASSLQTNVDDNTTKIVISKKESGGAIISEKFKVVDNSTNELKIDIQILKNSKKVNIKETPTIKNVKKDMKKPKMNKKVIAKKAVKDIVERYILTHVLDGHIIQESNEPFDVQKPTSPEPEPEIVKKKRGRPRKNKNEIVSTTNTRETRLSFNIKKDKLFDRNRQLSVTLCKLENTMSKNTPKNDKKTDARAVKPVVENEKTIVKVEDTIFKAKETVVENKNSIPVTKETILRQISKKGSVEKTTSVVQSEESLVQVKKTMKTKELVSVISESKKLNAEIKEPVAEINKSISEIRESVAEINGQNKQTKSITEETVVDSTTAVNFEKTKLDAKIMLVESNEPVTEIRESAVEAKKPITEETNKPTAKPSLVIEKNITECYNQPNEDNPFENVDKSTVRSWSVSDVIAHLARHNWHDSARLLSDQEIDGESLLLVSKEQLLLIGINENHAQVLGEFIEDGTEG